MKQNDNKKLAEEKLKLLNKIGLILVKVNLYFILGLILLRIGLTIINSQIIIRYWLDMVNSLLVGDVIFDILIYFSYRDFYKKKKIDYLAATLSLSLISLVYVLILLINNLKIGMGLILFIIYIVLKMIILIYILYLLIFNNYYDEENNEMYKNIK